MNLVNLLVVCKVIMQSIFFLVVLQINNLWSRILFLLLVFVKVCLYVYFGNVVMFVKFVRVFLFVIFEYFVIVKVYCGLGDVLQVVFVLFMRIKGGLFLCKVLCVFNGVIFGVLFGGIFKFYN